MDILIIEDEQYNQRLLQGIINNLRPQWNIVQCTDSVADSVEWLKNNKANLIFMDIQLSDGLCFSIFDKIKIDTPVIFTTAYDNFAVQAFKVNSIDYILKPVKDSDLEQAILKFEKTTKPFLPNIDYTEIMNAIKNGEKKYRNRVLIHTATAYYKIDIDQVAFFYSENKITYACTFNNTQHVVDMTLENLEDEIDPQQFFRANRQIIININAIVKFEDYFAGKLIVITKPAFHEQITISRLKNSIFKHWAGK